MAKNQNTFEKLRREMEKKRKNDEKRERRRRRKEGILDAKSNDIDSVPEEPTLEE